MLHFGYHDGNGRNPGAGTGEREGVGESRRRSILIPEYILQHAERYRNTLLVVGSWKMLEQNSRMPFARELLV